ncbi:MAG TPA: M20/M25/M40 family metallo-hydrolase [Candidatus Deferrimicrobium sp.]|nr:M20/M25/M40 family metallo-hydrolase [Candidatus Deferrimicrobium sp.]
MSLQDVFQTIENKIASTIYALKELVQIPSISAEAKGIECADVLIELLRKEIGFGTRKIQTSEYPIIYAEKMNGSKKTLIFYNHFDVQPVDPLEEWISPPFEPEIRDGRLYGRGVEDNKGNIIARIFAIKAYQSIFKDLPVNIKFIIEGQEEVGSLHLHEFVEKYPNLAQGDFCIWESGHRNADRQQQVWLGVKGILYLSLELKTAKRDIHSSYGGIIQNPAWELTWALASLKNKNQRILIDGFYDTVQKPTEEELSQLKTIPFIEKALRDDFGIQQFMKTGVELKRVYYYEPSLTIDGLNSGYQGIGSKTSIPAEAEAKIDIRLVPNQDPNDIFEKFKRHFEKNNFKNIQIILDHGYPPARTAISSEYLQIIRETGEKIYEQPLIIHPTSAGSGPMYLFIKKMDCISFGCGNENSLSHAPNENILLEDLLLNMKHLASIFHYFSLKKK